MFTEDDLPADSMLVGADSQESVAYILLLSEIHLKMRHFPPIKFAKLGVKNLDSMLVLGITEIRYFCQLIL